ncbi:MAG: hypothetical protein JO263_04100 [Candidatus Eremiobacteraeota bacterium]|nr:hypothetical protein [Candidatus Eremiobacteraeota bacterium]
MSSVLTVEQKIRRVEGFRAQIKHPHGADVRSDRQHLPVYPYDRAAAGNWTVERWKHERFRIRYPGFEVDVVLRNGESARGNTRLETVRRTYD